MFSTPIQDKPEVNEEKSDSKSPIVIKSKIEPPLSNYRDVNGKPYTASYFDIGSDEMPMIAGTLSRIEKYISSQIDKRGLTDTTESYDNLMQELFDTLGLEKTQRSDISIDKIIKLIDLLEKYGSLPRRT